MRVNRIMYACFHHSHFTTPPLTPAPTQVFLFIFACEWELNEISFVFAHAMNDWWRCVTTFTVVIIVTVGSREARIEISLKFISNYIPNRLHSPYSFHLTRLQSIIFSVYLIHSLDKNGRIITRFTWIDYGHSSSGGSATAIVIKVNSVS